jgi:peroxiredoxin
MVSQRKVLGGSILVLALQMASPSFAQCAGGSCNMGMGGAPSQTSTAAAPETFERIGAEFSRSAPKTIELRPGNTIVWQVEGQFFDRLAFVGFTAADGKGYDFREIQSVLDFEHQDDALEIQPDGQAFSKKTAGELVRARVRKDAPNSPLKEIQFRSNLHPEMHVKVSIGASTGEADNARVITFVATKKLAWDVKDGDQPAATLAVDKPSNAMAMCPCAEMMTQMMKMMSGKMGGPGQPGKMQTDSQSMKMNMPMPGMEGMTSRSAGGAMAGMSGDGATNSVGGAASGCCALPQQKAAAGSQPGGQTLLAGAEELFRTNPLLRPAPNTPKASTSSSVDTSANNLEKWSGPELGLFTLKSLSSSDVALSDFRGKSVIVHFFATWCVPCREEMESLRRFVSRTNNGDLSVLAVSVGEPEDRVRRFFDAVPVNFPILLDRDMTIARAWRVATLPTTYVLSPELKPKLILRGAQQWDQLDVAQIVKKLDEANREPSQPVGTGPTAPPDKK